jgi:eukaryotic-like serine/threonine-protein kinase
VTAQEPRSAEELFTAASSLPPEERESFLQHHCAGDEELQDDLRSLLAALDRADDFLETPVITAGDSELDAALDAPPLPARIGSYAILSLLGEGGMGTVYLARQEGTSREVALKVMRGACASPAMRRRFQHEAKTLALLHHPGIAQVYEAGLAEVSGSIQPFFAMELVHGRPLSTHAETAGLDTRQRLELLASVCDAVEHAHSRGVIHRDLKPANVLVDSLGRPRVLDFGVARASWLGESRNTMLTRPGQLIGTLAYMAPEQISDPDRVDARCDVYALGVMLYELLAGRVPLESESSTPLPEVLRRIREQAPPRLGSSHSALRGDIETIVAKALEKEPDRRYQTAAALAGDIRSHLSDQPITARLPTAMDQARRFVRRNRVLAGATAIVFLSMVLLVLGVSMALFRALAAEQVALTERQEATLQARRAEAVSRFLQDMLASVDPAFAQSADTALLRSILDAASERADQLDEMPEVEATIRLVIGSSYLFAGLYPKAEPHLVRAHELRRQRFGDIHAATLDAVNRLAILHHQRGNYGEAERLYRSAIQARRVHHAEDRRSLLQLVNNLGALYLELGRVSEAEPLCSEALRGREELLGEDHVDTIESMFNMGGLLWLQRRFAEVEPLWTKVAEFRQRMLGGDHPTYLSAAGNLALLYRETDRTAEAAVILASVLDRRRIVLGTEHPVTLQTQTNLAPMLVTLGKLDEAEAMYDQLLSAQKRVLGEEHLQTLYLMNNIASLYAFRGRPAEAYALLDTVVAHARNMLPMSRAHLSVFLTARAITLGAQARFIEAEADLLEALDLLISSGESKPETRDLITQMLIRVYDESGRPEDAEALRARSTSK